MMNKCLFIVTIASMILISGCVQQIGPGNPCEWVFKTDPSNIEHLIASVNIDRNRISSFRVFNATQLNNGYSTMSDSCSYHEYVVLKATSFEELKEYNITYGRVDTAALSAAIKDNKPFTVLYSCNIGQSRDLYERYIRECEPNSDLSCLLNKIIDSNELTTKCEKII